MHQEHTAHSNSWRLGTRSMNGFSWRLTVVTLAVLALVITASAGLWLVNPPQDAAAQTALPELKIAAATATVAEGGELRFTISASDPTLDRDLTVNLQVTEDTSQGRTYLAASERGSKRAVLYAGMETGTFTVKTVDDNNDEHDGAVTVTLRPGNGYTVGATNAATGTVTDKDGTHVTLTIGKSIIPENGGKTDITYRLRGPLKAGQTIAFKAGTGRDSNGRQGVDWTLQKKPGADNTGVTLSASGTVNGVTATARNPIVTMTGAGVREAKLELTAVDDTATSNRRITWFVGSNGGISNIFVQTLGGAQGSFRVSGRNHIYLIDDDNPPAPVIGFSRNAFSGNENGGLVQPVVNFSRVATPEFELPLTFTAGTATEGADYHEPGPQIVDLSSSSSTGLSFDIHLIDDKHKEGAETLTVAIDMDALPDLNGNNEGNGWVAGDHTTATITINDNDSDVHASISALDNIATEGSSSDKATFRVSLDSVRGAAGPLTDGDSARINFAFLGGAHGKDFDVNLLTNHPTLSSDGASVKFNPNAVSPAQDTPLFADFELIARQDLDAIDDVVRVQLAVIVAGSGTPTGSASGEARITLRDDDQKATGLRMRGELDGPIADDDGAFRIGEGSGETLVFGLTQAPTAAVNADASIISGSHAASITSGATNQVVVGNSFCYSRCPWRVWFDYNYGDPQNSTLNGYRIDIAGTEDIATVLTDDVTLRIALRSADKNYDGAVYEYPIKVIDNDQPISVELVSTSAIDLPESRNGRIRLGVRASRPVHTGLTPQLTWPDPSDTGHFTPAQDIDIAVEPIPVGGDMAYIYLDSNDDNVAEAEASATATMSLEETVAGVTVDQTRNTFLLRHSDDDNLNIRLIKRYASDNTVSYAVYFTRPVDYAIELVLKGKNSNDDRILGMPSTVTQNNPNLTSPHEYTIFDPDRYTAIIARTLGDYTFFDSQAIVVSDGIQLIDHDDPVPTTGPPLMAQSSEVSPQGTVRDSLTSGMGNGGGSLNDRVNAISVSNLTADGFTLGWSAANGADSYRVRYWQDENAVSVFPVTGTTHTVTGLDAETEYSVQIMAVVNGNVVTSKSSSVFTVTTAAAAAPAPTATPTPIPTATPTPAPIPKATPTPAPLTSAPPTATPAPQVCNLPSDAITVAEVTGWRDALDPIKAAAGVKRWNRVLATLGEDTGAAPMPAELARQVANWLGNTRWDRTARTLEAMAQCDNPLPTPTAAPTPTPQACTLPADAITVAEVTGWRDALDPIKAAAGIKRWNRVLATLGEDTGLTPMPAELAWEVANWLGNTRWDRTARTLEAMAQCDN